MTPRDSEFAAPPLSEAELEFLFERLKPRLREFLDAEKPWKRHVFVPSMTTYMTEASAPFMQYSSCSASDFFHPEFKRIRELLDLPEQYHRKYWEWAFVVHHAFRTGAVGPGKRALVFGVGQEALPAVFAAAGTQVTATDAPAEIGIGSGWRASGEYASGRDALPSMTMDRAEFERLVEWRECDMNAIDPAFSGYDFCWSSCCLEHLGDLRKGMEFIINAVENTLKIGGVAVHTTEFNLSSNDQTVESGPTVLYRRRDIDALIEELRARGHEVEEFRVAPDSLVIDGFVDIAPYSPLPHLKLDLLGYTSTSAGVVVRRGR